MSWFKKSGIPESTNEPALPEVLVKSLNAFPIHSLIIGAKNQIIFKSHAFETLNILKENKLVNEQILSIVRSARKGSESVTADFAIKRSGIGDLQRDVWCQATVLDNFGSVLLIIDDQSERSRIDAVRRDFITNISHELKTPITALGLNSDALLISLNDTNKVSDFARKIKAQSQRLADLVQEIIYLSRLQDTDITARASEISLNDVVREAIDLSEAIARVRNVEVQFTANEDVVVTGIRDQLVTAVHNLIENAINYSPENTRVNIAVDRKFDSTMEQEIAEIAVKDQGIGIADSEIDRIFERFYRIDPARSRNTGGTGLGLSIVKHVVQNHNGEIKVWSTPGIGSTFTLRIPILNKGKI